MLDRTYVRSGGHSNVASLSVSYDWRAGYLKERRKHRTPRLNGQYIDSRSVVEGVDLEKTFQPPSRRVRQHSRVSLSRPPLVIRTASGSNYSWMGWDVWGRAHIATIRSKGFW